MILQTTAKLKGLIKSIHVIRTVRNIRGITGAIFCFHVSQSFALSEFVLSGFPVHNGD